MSKKWLAVLGLACLRMVLTTALQAQSFTLPQLAQVRQQGWYQQAYRIPADSALKWQETDDINFGYLQTLSPAWQGPDSLKPGTIKLPYGHYVWVQVRGSQLHALYEVRSPLIPQVGTYGKQTLLHLYYEDGTPLPQARVELNGKAAQYQPALQAYVLPYFKVPHDDDIDLNLHITTSADSLWLTLNLDHKYYRTASKKRFAQWPLVRTLRKIPLQVKRMLNGEPNYNRRRRQLQRRGYKGFMVFNKPLYKAADTLRLKAWVSSAKKGKPARRPFTARLSYMQRGSSRTVNLGTLAPASPGSYLLSWPLPDSLPMDTRYNVHLKGRKSFQQLNGNFSTEQYLLPDVSSFTLTPKNETWLWQDSLPLSLEAKDVNGLPLQDGTVTLLALANQVHRHYADSVFAPDPLWPRKFTLSAPDINAPGKPPGALPTADITVSLQAILLNSSNERSQDTKILEHHYTHRQLAFTRQPEGLNIAWLINNQPTPAKALLQQRGDWLSTDTVVQLPHTLQPHALASSLTVSVLDPLGRTLYTQQKELYPNEGPQVSPYSTADSIGFTLTNEQEQPVWLTVWQGSQAIWNGFTRQARFSWRQQATPRHLYRLQTRYINQNDEEKSFDTELGILYQVLTVRVQSSPVVQPGATDTLQVKVTDYKGRPAPYTNLTAVAQNSQLSKHFRYPTLPYQMQFKRKKAQTYPYDATLELPALKADTAAALFTGLSQSLQIDSMPFYQWLANPSALQVIKSPIGQVYPQVTVLAKKAGRLVPVAISYVNRKPVHHYWLNTRQAASTWHYAGFAQVGVRTSTHQVMVDSVYLQPYHKHLVILNVDSLTPTPLRQVVPLPDTLTPQERSLLERYFIQLTPDSRINGAYLWSHQTQTVIAGSGNPLIAGPFEPGMPIQLKADFGLEVEFPFEPGYRYSFARQLTRLERMPMLPARQKIPAKATMAHSWVLADTTNQQPWPPAPPPLDPAILRRSFVVSHSPWQTQPGYGTLALQYLTDTAIRYTLLLDVQQDTVYRIYDRAPQRMHQLSPGRYRLLLVNYHDEAFTTLPVTVHPNGLSCYNLVPNAFSQQNPQLVLAYRQSQLAYDELYRPSPQPAVPNTPQLPHAPKGMASITGQVTDAVSGEPLAGVTVWIENTKTATTTNQAGEYTLTGLAAGRYTLQASYLGYQTHSYPVTVFAAGLVERPIALEVSNMALEEVVVVGYGTQTRKSLTASVATVSTLNGKVAGVQVGEEPNRLQIRGINTLNAGQLPLIIIDGVPIDHLPAGMDTSLLQVEVLKSAVATSLYGSRAAAGAIVITTGRNNGPTLRTRFSDYAYWQPNITTNSQGLAQIPVSYPDNITNWQHMVYAARKKHRYGSGYSSTRAFKTVQGLLQVPPFVIETDSLILTGKALNYGAEAKSLQTRFTLRTQQATQSSMVAANGFALATLPMVAPAAPDTLRPQFVVSQAKGPQDGEERSLPVLPRGAVETESRFYVLDADTTLQITLPRPDLPITWYTEGHLVNVLEKELEHLKNYPQACMEQTAHKMWGLLMMEKIKKATGQHFKYQKLVTSLQQRLLEHQQLDGGWGWWPGTPTHLYITTKVLQALRQADTTLPIKNALRNGYLFLQNQLPTLPQGTKIEAMYSLAEAGHVYPWQAALDTLKFDSLSLHQQWQVVRIKQKAGLPYQHHIDSLWKKRNQSYTGSIWWGTDSWYWYSNVTSTMVVAAQVIRADSAYRQYLRRLKQ